VVEAGATAADARVDADVGRGAGLPHAASVAASAATSRTSERIVIAGIAPLVLAVLGRRQFAERVHTLADPVVPHALAHARQVGLVRRDGLFLEREGLL